jgi:hypothetical protein
LQVPNQRREAATADIVEEEEEEEESLSTAKQHDIYIQGVCHTVVLPFTLKRNLRQKKNYDYSKISPCKNIMSKKYSKRNQNPSRYYYNSVITNLKFQHKPKYHLSKILI